jgi:hypothetical protein
LGGAGLDAGSLERRVEVARLEVDHSSDAVAGDAVEGDAAVVDQPSAESMYSRSRSRHLSGSPDTSRDPSEQDKYCDGQFG